MSRSLMGVIEKLKDSQGQYIFSSFKDKPGGTIKGYEVEFISAMPKVGDASQAGKAFIFFGDPKWFAIRQRRGVSISYSRDASIKIGSTTINLFQSDEIAGKVTERVALACKVPAAFSRLKTSSS